MVYVRTSESVSRVTSVTVVVGRGESLVSQQNGDRDGDGYGVSYGFPGFWTGEGSGVDGMTLDSFGGPQGS